MSINLGKFLKRCSVHQQLELFQWRQTEKKLGQKSLELRFFASRSQRSKHLEPHWQAFFQARLAQHGPSGGRVDNHNAGEVLQRIQKCYVGDQPAAYLTTLPSGVMVTRSTRRTDSYFLA